MHISHLLFHLSETHLDKSQSSQRDSLVYSDCMHTKGRGKSWRGNGWSSTFLTCSVHGLCVSSSAQALKLITGLMMTTQHKLAQCSQSDGHSFANFKILSPSLTCLCALYNLYKIPTFLCQHTKKAT